VVRSVGDAQQPQGQQAASGPNHRLQPTPYSLRCAALRPESEMVAHHQSSQGQEGKCRETGPCGLQVPRPRRAAESSTVRSSGDNGPQARSLIWLRTRGGCKGCTRVQDHLTARKADAAKEADRQCQKGTWEGQRFRRPSADALHSHRATGPILLHPWLSACQLGKPHSPHHRVVLQPSMVVSQPSGRGTAEGVQEARGSEGQPVMGWIGSAILPQPERVLTAGWCQRERRTCTDAHWWRR
jgi:hypothetical protein